LLRDRRGARKTYFLARMSDAPRGSSVATRTTAMATVSGRHGARSSLPTP
jgi:hypothetical protein